ncbi:exostosin domain-containing protein [Alkalihalobacterium alkalinitrilicum]|uniref:exostosin domain-containing protein n=1 Tax=Alkalihalobacterium alkalinitrilicum TaxID=427920 RepID=UPI0009957CE4|nr:exostosin family protein [Alkalihalobacterium alkalinitrilicum]
MTKIYILPVPDRLQPLRKATQRYPFHNKDYHIEEDFLNYLNKERDLLVFDPKEADWHYLPIFWTRWVSYGLKRDRLKKLKHDIDNIIIDDKKTFTICHHKDAPFISLDKTLIFSTTRKHNSIDVPLLSSPHRLPNSVPRKKYLASFVGSLRTHRIRMDMFMKLKHRKDIFLYNGNKGDTFFVNKLLESYISLCPRGLGVNSYRFFESMQLGVVPLIIGDIDTRPFKKYIDWDRVSYYICTVSNINELMDNLDKKELIKMGHEASILWKEKLQYQKWCRYVIHELNELK